MYINGRQCKDVIDDEVLFASLPVTKLKHFSNYPFLKFNYYI